MKIGVVSDTHSYRIPQQVLDGLKKADLIVHAGDFCTVDDLNIFKKLNKVRAVTGNMDGLELRQILPDHDMFEAEGKMIGLYHGHGAPEKVPFFVKAEFKKKKVDIVIFGHSHYPYNETENGVLYFNPGSPNDLMRAPYRSYGMIEIKNGKITAKIIKLKDSNG